MKTIGIFPAAGALGSSTARHLRGLAPSDRIILINRHPEREPEEYVQGGIRVRRAAFEDSPEALKEAFQGVDVLFLISYPSHVNDLRCKTHTAAINAAVQAGVSHIFYSSLAFAGPASSTASRAGVMQAHLHTENHLRALATVASREHDDGRRAGRFGYTILREGIYSESTGMYTGTFDPTNPGPEFLIPHDGEGPGIAWAKRDELGEASARLLAHFAAVSGGDQARPLPGLEQIELINQTLLLTGPKLWTLRETAEQLGTATAGQPARIREVSVDEYVARAQGHFGSAELAATWATAWDAIRAGETAVVDPLLGQILGRAPEEFDVSLKKQLESLR